MKLFINTHTSKIFEILTESENGELTLKEGNDASCDLISTIDQLTKNNITEITILTGPGSLTGLRIGAATAAGLALSKNIVLKGISVFELLLLEFPDTDIFFYTGTKKWIHKNKLNKTIKLAHELDFEKSWISNEASKLDLQTKNKIPYPNITKLMHKYKMHAQENAKLTYPVPLF